MNLVSFEAVLGFLVNLQQTELSSPVQPFTVIIPHKGNNHVLHIKFAAANGRASRA